VAPVDALNCELRLLLILGILDQGGIGGKLIEFGNVALCGSGIDGIWYFVSLCTPARRFRVDSSCPWHEFGRPVQRKT